MSLRSRARENGVGSFVFRVRVGESEVELRGTREEVLKTVQDLSELIGHVRRAFEDVKPKSVATLTVRKAGSAEHGVGKGYPEIVKGGGCGDAVARVLESDWGKWRPRTVEELRGALTANGVDCSVRVLGGVLAGLVRGGRVRRWDTDAGCVYILAEKEVVAGGGL